MRLDTRLISLPLNNLNGSPLNRCRSAVKSTPSREAPRLRILGTTKRKQAVRNVSTYHRNIHKYIIAWKLLIRHVIRHRLQLDYGAGLDSLKGWSLHKKLSFTFKRVSSLIVFDRLENPVRRNVCWVYEKWSIAISQLSEMCDGSHWNSKWWLYYRHTSYYWYSPAKKYQYQIINKSCFFY